METIAPAPGSDGAALAQPDGQHGLRHGPDPRDEGWRALASRLAEFSRLPDDWEDETSKAPLPATLRDAADFAAKAASSGVATPSLHLYGDGEVQLKWGKAPAMASVSFLADGNVVAYVRPSTRQLAVEMVEPYDAGNGYAALLVALRATF